MISFDRFERSLPVLLDELAAPRLPDYADDLFARTAATRQRSGWTFPERWIPMSAITRRLAAAPSIPWRLGALVALLALAALVAALVAGALLDRGPAPYGPAANGRIAFIDEAGRVVSGDPATGQTSVLAAEPGHVGTPLYSPDGSRIAYAQEASGQKLNIFVANADGSQPMQLNATPMPHPEYVGWSGSGERFLVVAPGGQMLLYDATRAAEPVDLAQLTGKPRIKVGLGYNFRSTAAFQPPGGDQLLFVWGYGEDKLGVVGLDGTGYRDLFDLGTSGLDALAIVGAEWSPDGKLIVLLIETTPDNLQPYLLNADGTGFRSLKPDLFDDPLENINSPLWSPDGTEVAFQHWSRKADSPDQEFHPIAIVDVATADLRYVGPIIYNGFVSWQWSPDGRYILEVPMDDSREILIVNAEKGASNTWDTAPWLVDNPIDWQRVAP